MSRRCRLVTWNVNSIRSRMDHLDRFITRYEPDILCLQETKVEDHLFPQEWLRGRGFDHMIFSGQKSYNGVAIISRIPLAAAPRRAWTGREDCRHLAVTLPNNIELHNFYVPAGGDIPDPALNDKFAHKLSFLEEMTQWSSGLDGRERLILVGDLNVAPLEHDVWSHKQLLKVVSHTPVETERMLAMQRAGSWVDVMRRFVPEDQKLYSWWSYRSPNWDKADKGRRLDHVWTSPAAAPFAAHMEVVRDARGWERPSDHVPVVVDFMLDDL